MPGLAPAFSLLFLAGPSAAQYRVAAPAEIRLAPSSFGSSAEVSRTMTPTALSPLLQPAFTPLSAASVQLAPSAVDALVPALKAAPAALEPLSAASLPDPVAAPAGGLGRVRALMSRARNWLLKPEDKSGNTFYDGADPDRPEAIAAPLSRIPWLFKLKDGDYLYHGTTLEDLVRLVESGGEMTPQVSQYSMRADDSIMYAAGRRDKLGLPDNPAVLLQFRYDELRPLVSADMFKADVLASAAYGHFSLHAAYVAATKPVPLSMMTRESKDSLLVFLRAQEARRPDQPKWADLRAEFEQILNGGEPRRADAGTGR